MPPQSHEDDSIRAVQTALEIHEVLLKETKVHSQIGVTTGTAFCGDVGTDARREYAMVGDIVVSVLHTFYKCLRIYLLA